VSVSGWILKAGLSLSVIGRSHKDVHMHSFISSRLDYCNSLLFDITDNLLRRVQAVQSAAARLVTGTRRHEHITPVWRQLRWLPVRKCIEFKLAVLVYEALNDCLRNTWWMTANLHRHQPLTTSIVERRFVWGSKNSHKPRRSIIHCSVLAFKRLVTLSTYRRYINLSIYLVRPHLWNNLSTLHLYTWF